MKIKSLILVISVSIFLLLTERVTASYYIDMLKDLDVKLLCILSYITLPLVAILLVVGGYLLISGTSPERRDSGKGLIINAIIGLSGCAINHGFHTYRRYEGFILERLLGSLTSNIF